MLEEHSPSLPLEQEQFFVSDKSTENTWSEVCNWTALKIMVLIITIENMSKPWTGGRVAMAKAVKATIALIGALVIIFWAQRESTTIMALVLETLLTLSVMTMDL